MKTDVRPVQLADIERRARAAIAERLGHSGSVTVMHDSDNDTAAVLTVDSGGNGQACTLALSITAGYAWDYLPSPDLPAVRYRIRPGDAVVDGLVFPHPELLVIGHGDGGVGVVVAVGRTGARRRSPRRQGSRAAR
ncbi:hypothetical protein [Streptomyces cavernae]|uniref:hypothetical protein n=1 Tax=Streptomyces cavernae TaxID=2259034 RepID=UPI000FEBB197|nr:hypothetical protein [Streptomyces cavernae]